MEMPRVSLRLQSLNRDVNVPALRETHVSLIDLKAGCPRINRISLTLCIWRQQQGRHNKHVGMNTFDKQILRLFHFSL